MRKPFRSALVLAAVVAFSSPALALEKTSRRLTDERGDWGASWTITVAYYNNCTGWVWVWSGWSPGEQAGVCYYPVDDGCLGALGTTWALTYSPAPSGYGFTGTVSIESACDCTGTRLASQPFLPAANGWNAYSWGVGVPRSFLVKMTWAAPSGSTNGTGFVSDHPFAGPTGPTSCGLCFPTTRVSNSLYYGVSGSACPGSALSDGLCDVEFMHEAAFACSGPVEDASWGQMKALYR